MKSSFSLPLLILGEAGPAQIPSGLCGVNSRGWLGGIFTPHFESRTRINSVRDKLREIVAGPPAEPSQFRSDIFKQTPHFYNFRASRVGCLALTKMQEIGLITHLKNHTYQTVKEIVSYGQKHYAKSYSIEGMTHLLHRLGFVYKKTKRMPGKIDPQKQMQFIKTYQELKIKVLRFFQKIDKYKPELQTLLTDSFQTISI